MSRFLAFLRLHPVAAAVVFALLIAACTVLLWPRERPASPQLVTPILAMHGLTAKSLYYNAAARPWLLAHRPELLAEEDPQEAPARLRKFPQAVQAPKLFRQLDRQYRFDALLLVGDPSQYRPLLDHLVETKDWTPVYVDHTSIVFRRDGTPAWELAQLAPLRAQFHSDSELATFLAQTAAKLVALRKHDAARQLLDEAGALDARSAEVANGLARWHMSRGEWSKALDHAERALELDRESLPALASKTQILFATRKFAPAYDLSKQLIERQPDDPNLLFYHAKIAHEAKAFREEAKTLQRLIELAERSGEPVSGYRIYLGQAYASSGEAQLAIEQFELVLPVLTISPDQRQFASQTLAQIRQRTGK